METKNERVIGLDLLKIICMFFVLTLHSLNYGGILNKQLFLSINYETAVFIHTLCNCAVDCFVIITGFVMCKRKIQFSNLMVLWLEVCFYSVVITLMTHIFTNTIIEPKEILLSFFPVITNKYWFFTAYFGLYFLMPFINMMFQKFSKRKMQVLLIVGFLLFSLLTTIAGKDLFYTGDGCGVIWFGWLYLVGAYINFYGSNEKRGISKTCLGLIYIVSAILLWSSRYILESTYYNRYQITSGGLRFTGYTSPLVVIMAVVLVMMFKDKKSFKKHVTNNIIEVLVPLSFGVYLIHDNPTFRDLLFMNKFISVSYCIWPVFLGYTIVILFSMFAILLMLDEIRKLFFELLHISKICKLSGNNIEQIVYKLLAMLFAA